MFTGLSAFPLTPLAGDQLDKHAYARLIERLVTAGVDSITALGSTGSYAYLSREERRIAGRIAVEQAAGVPVIIGIGALRTSQVLQYAEDAQNAGAAGLLLAPMSYQTLTDEDVYGLYEDVTREASVPVILYDNPGTTHVTFSDDLYRAIATLPGIASIKIPGVPTDPAGAKARIEYLRTILPDHVTIGISGDSLAATGLDAGCQVWYSVIAGTLPTPALAITRAAQAGNPQLTTELSAQLQPLWELFAQHGSLRVTAAIAEQLGLAERSCLPKPIRGLGDTDREQVARVMDQLRLT